MPRENRSGIVPNVSLSGVSPLPTCLLCQMNIPRQLDAGSAGYTGSRRTNPHNLLKRRLKGYWDPRLKHVMAPSIKIEEACFSDMPRIWSCFCRAIIKESDYKYRLTGIYKMQDSRQNPIQFPKDPEIASIGSIAGLDSCYGKYDSDIFTRFWVANMERQPSHYKGGLHGFLIHAHCWVLLTKIIGATPIPTEIQLKKLVLSSRKYWRDHKLHGLVDMGILCTLNQEVSLPYTYGCDIYKNPLFIPALQEVITREKNRAWNAQIRPGLNKFPMEINIMISEWVCPVEYILKDVGNMRNMLLAFQWKLPDWFWKRRLKAKGYLFFELDLLRKSGSPVNWQILRLDLMSLYSD